MHICWYILRHSTVLKYSKYTFEYYVVLVCHALEYYLRTDQSVCIYSTAVSRQICQHTVIEDVSRAWCVVVLQCRTTTRCSTMLVIRYTGIIYGCNVVVDSSCRARMSS